MVSSVKKRETFYLSGYDPRGARHYYNLYKQEAKKQAEVDKLQIEISTRRRTGKHIQTWHIDTVSEEEKYQTKTNYHFLEWDDIIRSNWKQDIFSLYLGLFYAMKTYLFSGSIFKYAKSSPIQMIAAFYPVVYLLMTLYLGFFLYNVTAESFISIGLLPLAAFLLALVIPYGIIKISIHLGNKLAVFWLLRIYIFSAKYVHTEMPLLKKRMEEFAKTIASTINNAKSNHVDEVLIVSHSVGTIITIPILANALKQTNVDLKHVSILTLGECIPLVSYLTGAQAYRNDMKSIMQKPLCWIDYTTPIDGACFPLLDFYKHSDIKIEENRKPYFLSPRFHTLFSKQQYDKLRKNRYLTHFIYLMATEVSGKYDFFTITSGHKPLSSYLTSKDET